MAITYPLDLPTSIGVGNIDIYAHHATAVSRSPFTFQSQIQDYTGQRWGATVTVPKCPREDAEDWITFQLSLKGQVGSFLMGDPNGAEPQGNPMGSPLVDGANQTGSTLNIKGCRASIRKWLKKGDYIQLGTGTNSRLYKVLKNVNSDSSGNATLDLWPDLRDSPTNNQEVIVRNCVGKFRLASNVTQWNINNVSFYGMTFDCEEAL